MPLKTCTRNKYKQTKIISECALVGQTVPYIHLHKRQRERERAPKEKKTTKGGRRASGGATAFNEKVLVAFKRRKEGVEQE